MKSCENTVAIAVWRVLWLPQLLVFSTYSNLSIYIAAYSLRSVTHPKVHVLSLMQCPISFHLNCSVAITEGSRTVKSGIYRTSAELAVRDLP